MMLRGAAPGVELNKGKIMATGKMTNDEYTAFLCVRITCLVASEGQLLNARRILIAYYRPCFVWGNIDILLPELRLGRRCVDGFREALALPEPRRLWEAVDCLVLLISSSTCQKS